MAGLSGCGSPINLLPTITTTTVSLAVSASTVYDNDASLTITATASQISDESIVITISSSGTAAEGNDYSTVSDITISSGSTTGTASFDPIEDSTYEGSETAVIYISSLSGADASLGSTSSVSIAIIEYPFRLKTNFVEGSRDSQETITANVKWTQVDYSGSTSTVHPYEQMNIHKVQSFSDGTNNLTGEGQLIHIADFNCDDAHEIYDNKVIYNLDNGGDGESAFNSATASDSHCQFVATMAAGDSTGNSSIMGVAPDADLVLSSIPNFEGGFSADDHARDLDQAKVLGAVASNNSWGAGINVSQFQDILNTYAYYTKDENLAWELEGSFVVSPIQAYITALNSFQETGVIVFSSGNDYTESDIDLMAGLPEFYPELAEAWVAVGLIDFTGSSIESAVESDFTLLGHKCGSAQEYCLVADAVGLNGASYFDEGTGVHHYDTNGVGSSFSAPMISGGIALLAQAFPNHTPEQLTDRLLASANNTWFTPEGETIFTTNGNSIKHGYHSTWGQGIPDLYAALSPITTSSNPSLAMYLGASIQTSKAQDLSSSLLVTSSSYGDAITLGLKGEATYGYDSLSGGFKIDMTSLVAVAKEAESLVVFDRSFSKLAVVNAPASRQSQLTHFDRVISKYQYGSGQTINVTMGAKTIPVQSFLGSNIDSAIDIASFSTPYLNQSSGSLGIGAGTTYPIAASRLLLGFTLPLRDGSSNVQNENTSMTASLESDWNNNTTTTLLSGLNSNASGPLGMNGFGALDMEDAHTTTKFIAMKFQSKLAGNVVLTAIASASNSSSSKPSGSLIGSSDNIRSSSLGIGTTITNIHGDGALSISVSQPDRISSGSLNVGIPQLSDSDGHITKKYKAVSLSPSGRQLDFHVAYTDAIFSKTAIRLEYTASKQANHLQESSLVHAGFIGVSSGGLKMGAKLTDQRNSNHIEMRYGSMF